MTSTIAGTFSTSANGIGAGLFDQQSGVLVVPSSGRVVINASPLDTNNKIRLQTSTDNGVTWSSVSTFTTDQVDNVTTPTPGHQRRLVVVAMEAGKTIHYKMTAES